MKMKAITLIISIFFYFSASAQENKTGIPIPMKNGIVFYEKTFALDQSISNDQLYSRSKKWLKASFPESPEKISIDKSVQKISSNGLFKITTDENTGHYYWIKLSITILITKDSCTIQSYNYYEKPIMPGVTNDYSKIEYRWWDFRKGTPWNNEDEALFKGLNQQTLSFISSFEKEIAH